MLKPPPLIRDRGPEDSVGRLLRRIELGDKEAFGELVGRSSEIVLRIFRQWYGRRPRPVSDEEDLAQMLFLDLWKSITRGELAEIQVGQDFWRYLFGAAMHRVLRQRRYERSQKRDPGPMAPSDDLLAVPANVPSGEAEAAFADELESLMAALPDDEHRWIAYLRLHRCSNRSIGVLLHLPSRTVDRKVSLIKEIWEAQLVRQGDWPRPRDPRLGS